MSLACFVDFALLHCYRSPKSGDPEILEVIKRLKNPSNHVRRFFSQDCYLLKPQFYLIKKKGFLIMTLQDTEIIISR